MIIKCNIYRDTTPDDTKENEENSPQEKPPQDFEYIEENIHVGKALVYLICFIYKTTSTFREY